MSRKQRRKREKDRRHSNERAARRRQLVAGTGVTVGATLLLGGTAQAACTCQVNSLLDPTDPGKTTLRDAINSAETSANSGSTITFASTLSGTITLGSDLPDITYPTTIQGPGAGTLAISGNDAHRIVKLRHAAGAFPVAISGLTLTHGHAAPESGGAIYSYNAELTITGTVLSQNTAAGGGAILTYSGSGELTISDSSLTGNTTGGSGGAIYAVGTPVTIQDTTMAGNHAYYRGGAIGIDDPSGLSTIENSTLAGNIITGDALASRGGGLYVYGAEHGVLVLSSTLVGNYAREGGGAFNHNAFTPPPVVLHNTIVGGNSVSVSGPDLGGPFDSAFSLIENTSGATVTETTPGSDITGQDPQLGALAANGGATQTMRPALTSPAVDKGSAFVLPSDQRGQTRPFDVPSIPNSTATGADGSDIGAVELQESDIAPPPVTPAAPLTPATTVKKKKCKNKKHKRSAESAKKKCKKKKRK
jgi:hypothetical protein